MLTSVIGNSSQCFSRIGIIVLLQRPARIAFFFSPASSLSSMKTHFDATLEKIAIDVKSSYLCSEKVDD